jgi:hypothetical protein
MFGIILVNKLAVVTIAKKRKMENIGKMHNKSLQHRSGTSCLRWTVFKSRLCGFAAQK